MLIHVNKLNMIFIIFILLLNIREGQGGKFLLHSAIEIIILMYILYLEWHTVEILNRIDSFYSR